MANRLPYEYSDGAVHQALINLLYEAIPQEAEEKLRRFASGDYLNGGTCRGWMVRSSAVCTYNNTIKSEQEILAWYQRARELAGEKGGAIAVAHIP